MAEKERKEDLTSVPGNAKPPEYTEAASASVEVHHFVRHSRWSSKVYIQADGINRYCFAPDKKEARVWIYAGASTENKALGFLDFPKQHNAFRLNFSIDSSDKYDFTDVKSRIGHPHSGSFSLKTTISGRMRDYQWVNRSPGREVKPVVYDLIVGGLQKMAVLTVNKKGKGVTTIHWVVHPDTELEQALLVLSAVGVIVRLSNQGIYKEREIPSGQKWFAIMWQSALMGLAYTM